MASMFSGVASSQADMPRFYERVSAGKRYAGNNQTITVLRANELRREASIQNLGSNKLYVRLGLGASDVDDEYDILMSPGEVAGDGKGDKIFLNWKGDVSVYGENADVLVSENY